MRRFEGLDYQPTPIGAVSLLRRFDPQFDTVVYEIKLDDDFLMSSLFTAAEVELARLGLTTRRARPTWPPWPGRSPPPRPPWILVTVDKHGLSLSRSET